MSIPTDFKFLTKEQVTSILKKNIADEGNTTLATLTAGAMELIISAIVDLAVPVNTAEVIPALITLLSTLVGEADDKVSLILDLIQFCKLIEKDINDKIQFGIDLLQYERDNDPDSLIFDALRWNKILGKALNYNSDSDTSVVKELEDGSFDFRSLLGFKPDNIHQRYLSEELQYLLNCKMEVY